MHIEIQNCFSFRGTSSPDPLPGLRPWTPLGDFCPPYPCTGRPPHFVPGLRPACAMRVCTGGKPFLSPSQTVSKHWKDKIYWATPQINFSSVRCKRDIDVGSSRIGLLLFFLNLSFMIYTTTLVFSAVTLLGNGKVIYFHNSRFSILQRLHLLPQRKPFTVYVLVNCIRAGND